MGELTLTLTDAQIKRLQDDSEAFARIAMKRDPRFALPTFETFVRSRLLDNATILTEDAVSALLVAGEYGWATRSFEKGVPDLFKVFIEEGAQFGFTLVRATEWSQADTAVHAQEWATHVVAKAGGKSDLAAPLAAQIVANSQDFKTLEQKEQTPAWHVSTRLHEMLHATRRALDTTTGSDARDKLGQLRALMRLAIVYGSLTREEERGVIDSLHFSRPELFVDEPDDLFAHIAAMLRRWFLPHTLRPNPSQSEPAADG
jgi:hypothetical protein